MPNDIDEVSRLLGELGGKLDALTRQADNNERNSKGRWKTVYDRLDAQDQLIESAANDIRYMQKVIVDDVKPVTDEVKRWKLMGMGALAVTGLGAASIGAGFVWLWQNIFSHAKL